MGIQPPKQLCSDNQVTTGEFESKKSFNEVYHLHI